MKWLIFESLPSSFDAIKLTYNALKEEWTLEELTSIMVVVNLDANMIETNIIDVHANFLWLDIDVIIHVTTSLIGDCVLSDLDFSNLETYVDCIKRKLIAKKRKEKINMCMSIMEDMMKMDESMDHLLCS